MANANAVIRTGRVRILIFPNITMRVRRIKTTATTIGITSLTEITKMAISATTKVKVAIHDTVLCFCL